MQSAFIEELPDTMPEKPIDIYMLQRIDDEQKKTADHVKVLDKRLQDLAVQVGEIKGAVRPPTETPGWIRYIVYPLCVLFIAGMTGGVVRLTLQMGEVETFLKDNGGFIAAMRLKSVNPSDSRNAEDAGRILAEARRAKIKIPTEAVQEVGERFVHAPSPDPNIWAIALALVSYKSSLNYAPINADWWTIKSRFRVNYFRGMVENGKRSEISAFGQVPIDQAAVVRLIGSRLKAPQEQYGNRFVVLHDGDVLLNSMELRHVIIANARVVYTGGKVIMQEVYFVNCTFDFPRQPDMQSLASVILQKPTVDLTVS
jgi:hypothetical protein